MSKAIIIATNQYREEWVKECLKSLEGYTTYPIIVVSTGGYEIGKIKWIYDNTSLDEFLFIQDTVIVKNYGWIDEAFEKEGLVSLSKPPFFMYMGKYTRKALDGVRWPHIVSKLQAVTEEFVWTQELGESHILWPDLQDNESREQHNGRMNMVLENDHIKKYKGTWDISMI